MSDLKDTAVWHEFLQFGIYTQRFFLSVFLDCEFLKYRNCALLTFMTPELYKILYQGIKRY